ncbi:protein-S-isoprenylcysteine O-methyltransferase Ste14 [Anaerosolibacter carboniphilus]|uniref:Protein-S-isoprenylcysteine O-methyltransferase Ste14 n=1 Tax=Anaerosolibacter carboniphilus TaxID=1417629 RepID=A0A841KYV1_9FIRM|nr:isoprenylcysteine carboxylmethyltransferase family protein [Anaerosolibacter carboniphilus]MBB6215319.1 protein-S-isoprenylcysteine O-methyltransferase Ste14 [Anaerosolibacter carboniphilus]
MKVTNVLSFILFIIFLVSYLMKLFMLYRRHGIHGNVLGKGKKGREIDHTEILLKITTFVWGFVWFFESVADDLVRNVFKDFPVNDNIRYVGIAAMAAGLGLFILAMITMRTSWRVGIDKKTKTELITEGIYRYSRNPAFVGFDLMFTGVFLTYPNILTFFVFILNVMSIHKLILQEEKHLEMIFQERYREYKNETARYLFF